MKKALFALSFALLATTPIYAQYSTWGAFVNVEGALDSNGEHQLEPEAFIPVYEGGNNLIFIDLRGYLRNPIQGGLNLGFGYRHMVTDKIVLGANAFYDMEGTENGNVFHQAGLGLELLTERTELRMNFYLPFSGDKEILDTQVLYGQITDGNFEVVYKQGDMESAMPGMDAFFTFNQPLPHDFFLTATVGGYMYFGGEFHDNVYGFGASLGIEKDFDIFGGADMTLGAKGMYGWNTEDGHHGGANFNVKISFGGSGSKKGAERQLYSSVERENDIKTNRRVVDTEASTYNGTTTINGVTYSGLTEVTAADDVEGTIEGLGEETLILLRREEGVIHVSSAIDLNKGQAIIGSGRVFEVVGPQGQTCYVIVDSEQAEIVGDAGLQAVFNLNDKVTLANMDISGNGPVVVYGENIDDANIVGINFDISDGQTALMINGGSNINVEDITVDASSNSIGTTAMQIEFSNGTTIKNVDVSGVQTGFVFDQNENLYVNDINIVLTTDQTFTAYGMILTENVNTTIDDINVYGNGGNSAGIVAFANSDLGIFNSWFGNHTTGIAGALNEDLTIDNTRVENSEIGIDLQHNDNTTLNDVDASDNGIGIKVEGGNYISLTDIITNDNDTTGIQILDVHSVYVNGLTSNGNGGNGAIITNADSLVLNSAVAKNNGGMGIYVYQVTSVTGDQIEVSGNLNDGIYVGTSSTVNLDGIIANNNGGSGAYLMDVTSAFMENVLSTNNLDSGIAISDSMLAVVRNSIVTGNAQGVFISNNTSLVDIDGVAADQNITVGILVDTAVEVNIDQSTAENNWGDGIEVFFADYVTMQGVVASYNSNIGIYFFNVWLAETTDVTVEGNGTDFVDVP